jgi:hypothetical protein
MLVSLLSSLGVRVCLCYKSAYLACMLLFETDKGLTSSAGSSPGVWATMLQSAKCGAIVVVVDNSLYSVCSDGRA